MNRTDWLSDVIRRWQALEEARKKPATKMFAVIEESQSSHFNRQGKRITERSGRVVATFLSEAEAESHAKKLERRPTDYFYRVTEVL